MDVIAAEPTQTPDPDALYRHQKRTEWGVALFLWERDDKRAFRFADGEIRVFKRGFYDLMVPAATPADGSAAALRDSSRARGLGKKPSLPTVGDQLTLLLARYPMGFAGPTWIASHRGGGRRLKRHRDPSVNQARELLGASAVRKAHAARNYRAALDALVELLAASDLVPDSQIKRLRQTKPSEGLSAALIAFVDDPQHASVGQLQAALAHAPNLASSWQILTAPLALLAPREHLCVNPGVFATQGAIVVSGFDAPKRASEAGYQRYLEVARMVEYELAKLGHRPSDRLDLHDFMWTTLRPSASDELTRIHARSA